MSTRIDSFHDEVAEQMFSHKLTEAHARSQCIDCGGHAKEFRDRLSWREYNISGLCQACQDSVFGLGR